MAARKYELTIPAGAVVRQDSQAGAQIHCVKASAAGAEVSLDAGQSFSIFEEGLGYTGGFPGLIFRNETAAAISLSYVVATGATLLDDRRENGQVDVDIFGNITTKGDPLSENGGSISSIGASFASQTIDNTAVTSITSATLVSASSNTSGVVVRTVLVSVENINQSTNPNAAAYLNVNSWPIMNVSAPGIGSFNHDAFDREFHLKPGEGLRLSVFPEMKATAQLTFDLL